MLNKSLLKIRAIIFFLLPLTCLITACSSQGTDTVQSGTYQQISQEQAAEMMLQDDDHVVVDVRRQDEYDEGHIPGAILIPNESIGAEQPDALPDLDQIILVYCRSGRRSKEAAQKLANIGYTSVYEFGGIIDWTGDIATDDIPAGDTLQSEPKEESSEAVSSAQTKQPILLYQGHASLRIVTGEGKVIYIDPFAGDGYDLPADIILVTHSHYDHGATDLITEQNDDVIVYTWNEALQGGAHQSISAHGVRIEAVEAGYNANHDVSQCVGFLLTFENDVTLYVSGDTSTMPQMAQLANRNIDYAFFCCDGVYNMDVEEASRCAQTVSARHSIPYHTIAANEGIFDRSVADAFDVDGKIILEPGEELVLQ